MKTQKYSDGDPIIAIEVGSNKCRLKCSPSLFIQLQKKLSIRNRNAYYIKMRIKGLRGWDGYNQYITDSGSFDTGLLPLVYNTIKELSDNEIVFIDVRELPVFKKDIPTVIGGRMMREYQVKAIESIKNNKVGKLKFPMGLIDAATNAGKTMIAMGIHMSVSNAKTVYLVNQLDLYKDALEEFQKVFGHNNVGYIQGKNLKWADIMICMVPTLRTQMPVVLAKISQYNVLIFDECDTALAPSNKKIIQFFYNAPIRIGLSGSIDKATDPNTNRKLHAIFGDVIFKISNKELIDSGYSANIQLRMLPGSDLDKSTVTSFDKEYENGIIKNDYRNNMVIKRIRYFLSKGIEPILVICKNHQHIEILYRKALKEFGDKYTVKYVHHLKPDRKQIQDDFAKGKIDILIGSYILKRGKNFPYTRYLCNAAGGLSASNVLQVMGRLLRIHPELKEKVKYIDDFWDSGKHLLKHSKKRFKVYEKEGISIKNKKIITGYDRTSTKNKTK